MIRRNPRLALAVWHVIGLALWGVAMSFAIAGSWRISSPLMALAGVQTLAGLLWIEPRLKRAIPKMDVM